MAAPRKNLKKCACMMERAKDLENLPAPSVTDAGEVTSREQDGLYTAKQCNRSACWCVNPKSGSKLSTENRATNALL